jgi:hypothetical protein
VAGTVYVVIVQVGPLPFGLIVTVAVQRPPEHRSPAAQTIPHPPQSSLSEAVEVSQPFDASPSQLPKPALQLATPQLPARQNGTALGRLHAPPQAPQLEGSIWRFVHAPAQLVSPAPQEVAQAPMEQTCPPAQALPQAPQWRRSLWRSRQTPRHAVCPAAQESAQVPESQTCPPAQALPQAPQLSRSFWRSRQTDPQVESPVAHDTAHDPLEQT